jgi:hypothetical protein
MGYTGSYYVRMTSCIGAEGSLRKAIRFRQEHNSPSITTQALPAVSFRPLESHFSGLPSDNLRIGQSPLAERTFNSVGTTRAEEVLVQVEQSNAFNAQTNCENETSLSFRVRLTI